MEIRSSGGGMPAGTERTEEQNHEDSRNSSRKTKPPRRHMNRQRSGTPDLKVAVSHIDRNHPPTVAVSGPERYPSVIASFLPEVWYLTDITDSGICSKNKDGSCRVSQTPPAQAELTQVPNKGTPNPIRVRRSAHLLILSRGQSQRLEDRASA
ncbi:hypothetical protein NFI96_007373 [Prochilodus magdalenae]|nr:hypothetical protein NFI96_007373 [Prochilodus magdalenae]